MVQKAGEPLPITTRLLNNALDDATAVHLKNSAAPDFELDQDAECFKDLWFPGGEELKFRETKEALLAADYVVRDAGIGETRAAWFFHLVRGKRLRRVRFQPHLHNLLVPLGLQIPDQGVTVERFGQNLIILIFWPVPASGEARRDAWEEICNGATNQGEFVGAEPAALLLKVPPERVTNRIASPTEVRNEIP
jgi:hypothetical protein